MFAVSSFTFECVRAVCVQHHNTYGKYCILDVIKIFIACLKHQTFLSVFFWVREKQFNPVSAYLLNQIDFLHAADQNEVNVQWKNKSWFIQDERNVRFRKNQSFYTIATSSDEIILIRGLFHHTKNSNLIDSILNEEKTKTVIILFKETKEIKEKCELVVGWNSSCARVMQMLKFSDFEQIFDNLACFAYLLWIL